MLSALRRAFAAPVGSALIGLRFRICTCANAGANAPVLIVATLTSPTIMCASTCREELDVPLRQNPPLAKQIKNPATKVTGFFMRPQGDLNPCRQIENLLS